MFVSYSNANVFVRYTRFENDETELPPACPPLCVRVWSTKNTKRSEMKDKILIMIKTKAMAHRRLHTREAWAAGLFSSFFERVLLVLLLYANELMRVHTQNTCSTTLKDKDPSSVKQGMPHTAFHTHEGGSVSSFLNYVRYVVHISSNIRVPAEVVHLSCIGKRIRVY